MKISQSFLLPALTVSSLSVSFGFASQTLAQEIQAGRVKVDLSKAAGIAKEVFESAPQVHIALTAQPMAVPRPKVTTTDEILVRAVHNDTHIAFQLSWKDDAKDEAGPLGKFSDAVAIQFPVKDNANPPPIFMGIKDNPVHIFHWRAQYQADKERGIRTIRDIYPHKNVDIYPMEFPGQNTEGVSDAQREVYSYGKAAGNPQSYVKKGVDEIFAEGFGSSSVAENVDADAQGEWKDGRWQVVITRPLKRENGSQLHAGQGSFAAFAVWQGGKGEVGSRKCLTMAWTPLNLAP